MSEILDTELTTNSNSWDVDQNQEATIPVERVQILSPTVRSIRQPKKLMKAIVPQSDNIRHMKNAFSISGVTSPRCPILNEPSYNKKNERTFDAEKFFEVQEEECSIDNIDFSVSHEKTLAQSVVYKPAETKIFVQNKT